MSVLYYIHDPMCSWCWGFNPAFHSLLDNLPDGITIKRLLGGLAPDNDNKMPEEMQIYLQNTWRRIQERIPGTEFNYDFWGKCIPRRSTYPACRAVIAARLQGDEYDKRMTHAIQHAYYLEVRNPSDIDTLLEIGREIGLDDKMFSKDLTSKLVQHELLSEISLSRKLNVDSYPALVLQTDAANWRIPVNYTNSEDILEKIRVLISQA